MTNHCSKYYRPLIFLVHCSISDRVAISRIDMKEIYRYINISHHWYEISALFKYTVSDKHNFLVAIIRHHLIRLHNITSFAIFPALDSNILFQVIDCVL